MSDHDSQEDPMNIGIIEDIEDISDGKYQEDDLDENMLDNLGIEVQSQESQGPEEEAEINSLEEYQEAYEEYKDLNQKPNDKIQLQDPNEDTNSELEPIEDIKSLEENLIDEI